MPLYFFFLIFIEWIEWGGGLTRFLPVSQVCYSCRVNYSFFFLFIYFYPCTRLIHPSAAAHPVSDPGSGPPADRLWQQQLRLQAVSLEQSESRKTRWHTWGHRNSLREIHGFPTFWLLVICLFYYQSLSVYFILCDGAIWWINMPQFATRLVLIRSWQLKF